VSDTLANLQLKISGAVKLKSVVRTMKAVAASSIGQYEASLVALADYERSVKLGLSVCFQESASPATASGKEREPRSIGAVVFGSDQGLVGQFNETMADFVEKTLGAIPGEKKMWIVGERIEGRLLDAGFPSAGLWEVPGSVEGITSLVGDLQIAIESQSKQGCREVYVFHSRPTSGSLYEPVSHRLLPLDATWRDAVRKTLWPTKNLPQLFGDGEKTLAAYVREYLFLALFKACAESLASENASRLAAMQRAEKNIDSLATALKRRFSRMRQNSIDEELFEVVAGFNALQ
jgi:F-type H+-transporting ATPase subunit gamma